MSKRIRYVKSVDGFYVSTRMVQTASGEVAVKYNPESKVVLIVNGNDTVLHNWISTSNHEMKKDIKKKLIEMGANFDKETRVRQ